MMPLDLGTRTLLERDSYQQDPHDLEMRCQGCIRNRTEAL